MPSKKLITLLQTFSTLELNRFRKYLASPYFNEHDIFLKLFDEVEKYIRHSLPNHDVPSPKQIIWQQIFNNTPYNDAQMRR